MGDTLLCMAKTLFSPSYLLMIRPTQLRVSWAPLVVTALTTWSVLKTSRATETIHAAFFVAVSLLWIAKKSRFAKTINTVTDVAAHCVALLCEKGRLETDQLDKGLII